MIVNRNILESVNTDEQLIKRMLVQANRSPIRMFDKMATSSRGYLVAMPHFDIDELIKFKKSDLKNVMPRFLKSNEVFLKEVLEVRKCLDKLKVSQVNEA